DVHRAGDHIRGRDRPPRDQQWRAAKSRGLASRDGVVNAEAASKRGDQGAALIEIMVAVVILVSAVIGLASSTISARRAGDSSRHAAEATTLAFDKIEHLRTLLPTDPELSPGSHTDPANPLGPDGNSGGFFTRSWTVTSNLPIPLLARVEMDVAWATQTGTRSVTLVGFVLQ
ncbi:MAG: type IV pilus modification PilV family protein, partial [Candidatus Binatia bacterium]